MQIKSFKLEADELGNQLEELKSTKDKLVKSLIEEIERSRVGFESSLDKLKDESKRLTQKNLQQDQYILGVTLELERRSDIESQFSAAKAHENQMKIAKQEL